MPQDFLWLNGTTKWKKLASVLSMLLLQHSAVGQYYRTPHKSDQKENSVLNCYFRYRYTTIVKGKQCIWL